jgi:hypothetical protein
MPDNYVLGVAASQLEYAGLPLAMTVVSVLAEVKAE